MITVNHQSMARWRINGQPVHTHDQVRRRDRRWRVALVVAFLAGYVLGAVL